MHELGARHLADPSRLMASARRVYGDELDGLFGTLAPTPAERIRAVERTGVVDLGGGRRLESHYSPGHARHHVGLIDSVSGDLYVGDAAGIYIQETGDMRPATPPPDFDLDVALASLRTFAALQPARLLFSHFGPVTAVEETLDRSAAEISLWVDETRRARGAGMDLDHAAAMVAERTRRALRRAGRRTPTRESPRRSSGSAARPPTWPASCTGWTRPSRPRRSARTGAPPGRGTALVAAPRRLTRVRARRASRPGWLVLAILVGPVFAVFVFVVARLVRLSGFSRPSRAARSSAFSRSASSSSSSARPRRRCPRPRRRPPHPSRRARLSRRGRLPRRAPRLRRPDRPRQARRTPSGPRGRPHRRGRRPHRGRRPLEVVVLGVASSDSSASSRRSSASSGRRPRRPGPRTAPGPARPRAPPRPSPRPGPPPRRDRTRPWPLRLAPPPASASAKA